MKSAPILTAAICFFGQPALAATDTGIDLQGECRLVERSNKEGIAVLSNGTDVLGFSDCLGYLRGFMDGMASSPPTPNYCPPKTSVTSGQMSQIFLKFADAHPEQLHRPAAVLALKALLDAYPCSPPAQK